MIKRHRRTALFGSQRRTGPRLRNAVSAAGAAALMVAVAACSSSGSAETSSTASSTSNLSVSSSTSNPSVSTTVTTGSSTSGSDLPSLVPAEIRQRGYITLATNASFGPPCTFYATSNSTEMIGRENDLWNAIAAKLNLTVKPTSIAEDSVITSVQAGRFDMAMECLRDSEVREKQVDFVDMLYSAVGFLVPSNNPHNVSSDQLSVCGLNVALVSGQEITPYVSGVLDPACKAAGKSNVKVTELLSGTEVTLAVKSGRADFTIFNISSAGYLINKKNEPWKIFSVSVLPRKYSGAIFPKASTRLRDAWLKAAEAVWADGKYASIMKEWGAEDIMLDAPGINLATAKPLPDPLGKK